MPRTVAKTIFKFDELEDAAKEKAREWFREGNMDYDWYTFIYEDAATIGRIIGIEFDDKLGRTMGGQQTRTPKIWFSGFSSQGDGACFEGNYAYAKGATKAIRQHAPKDTELHRIADELQALQRPNFYRLTANTKHCGHYYHSGCMSVDVYLGDGYYSGEYPIAAHGDAVTQLLRDFADWIYKQLETEHDWHNSDEQVDDNIRANEYEFDENGNIH